ncbi:MAG: hypothetical protein B6U95_07700 [Thermofilum sp. ex4484_82]|nr:MAG: hypothetical protein B6U95_07700 [Thermofilum sp. ex4484_82]
MYLKGFETKIMWMDAGGTLLGRCVMEAQILISAPPHDLLKLLWWKEHTGLSAVKHLPKWFRKKCRKLTEIIQQHHREELWSKADKYASAMSRLKLYSSYWATDKPKALPFLIRVYGKPRYWPHEEREKLWRKILSIYEKLGECPDAHIRVNELLSEFPQDSRFPLVSLKTHHWLTWILKKRLEDEGDIKEIYVMKISIPEQEFHRLKEKREFYEKRDKFLKVLTIKLSKWNPLRIGDELFIVLISEDNVKKVLSEIKITHISCDIDIFTYHFGKVKISVGDKEKSYIRVRSYDFESFSVGVSEDWRYAPSERVEWIRYMNYPYVAWISVRPVYNLQESARKFLEWAEKEILNETPKKEETTFKNNMSVCPELLLSVAEGYSRFLLEFAKNIDSRVKPDEITIVRSFDSSLFIYGLKKLSKTIEIYERLIRVVENLHIPVSFSIVVAKPKHPFWRVLNLFHKGHLIYVIGGRTVMLSDEEIELLRKIIPLLENVSKRQFHKVICNVKKMGKEELKLMIEGLAAEGKLGKEGEKVASKLCWLIDELAKRHPDEDKRVEVTYKTLKMLTSFMRKERGRGG